MKLPVKFNLFPLFWLVYLIFPLLGLFQERRAPMVYAAALAGLAVFLWLYVKAFWTRGDGAEKWTVLGWAWCFVLYVAGFGVFGGLGSAFLIYGASMIGFQPAVSLAAWLTFANVSAMLAPLWLGKYGVDALAWLAPNVVIALFAAYANQATYRRLVADRRLAQVQAEKERLAQTAERERIARDLHDLLGHTLSVIVLKSELAAKLSERDPKRAVSEIREVERISREALSEVRAAVRGYRGSGLDAELGRAKVALDTAGITLEYIGEPLTLPRPVEATMELVLREAVTNVVRHANARKCRIRVACSGGAFELEVHDDGRGGDAVEGSGLTGMRERVRAVGGELSRDGRSGTRLLASFPLPKDEVDAGAALPRGATA
ncbi:sensor histidine kinase [Deinococcus yavapaiensis]|uniref:Two-component system sensor histidine kinase DesK n=1 Tax=Deinococcus yavapaiensis KR-236 TaxID=694435 RepID=A0A318SEA6_9DEIO|nr:sensor histidine kinase [Deinococcus yavapaiensis]PYE51088.1 two-component system sensor histidine kinase DesK [Deinococcus yavapaiensis KR-236]